MVTRADCSVARTVRTSPAEAPPCAQASTMRPILPPEFKFGNGYATREPVELDEMRM